ncbi:VWA domain-containing protein [Chitinophaga lutea]
MHFEIAHTWVFFLLPLPLLVWWLVPPLRRRRSALLAPFFQRAAAVSGERPRRSAWVSKRSWIGWIVLSLCWICLLGAASSPRFVSEPGKQPRTVRSFLIAADVSYSMAQTDWVVHGKRMSRWDAVKLLMKDFVEKRKSDQISLVVFGSNAFLQAPLTTDLPTISWLLDQTEVGMAGQMTNIGDAIAFSVKVLQEDTIPQKVMFLLTDGVDTGTDILPLDAANMAQKDSITIYTMGIGTAGTGSGYDLDEKTLRAVADVTGGQYFNAKNEAQLNEVYATLDKLAPVTYEEVQYKPVTLLYYYPLAAGALLAITFQFLNGMFGLWRREA